MAARKRKPSKRASALIDNAGLTSQQKVRVRMSQVVAAVRAGAVDVRSAAAGAKVDRQCVYEWLRKAALGDSPYVEFREEFDGARQEKIMGLTQRVEAASLEDWRAAEALLKRYDLHQGATDSTADAWANLSREEQIEAVARNPEVVKRVLANQRKELPEG